ncbi:unnamed protein product [Cuscuta europaea]|uniref:non-specific serine/threonine protein kinase n=1 Tax=Cuscuta europaea TaxID=41803 RepID=A0A9P0ZV65_CUSEU|nr:unnamed protein product [Cuscuta europaea]
MARITIISLLYLHQCLILAMPNPTNITTDQSSLLFLKATITSDPHRILAGNWTAKSSVCGWVGVKCDYPRRQNSLRVVALNLADMDLSGLLPPQLGNLTFLSVLDLTHNRFTGHLPEGMANLRRLRVLDLGSNQFAGEIPSWLSLFPKLQVLSLAGNNFTGLVPQEALFNISGLEVLDLSKNGLKGIIQGAEMCRGLRRLRSLDLSSNEFHGPIPLSNGSDCTQLIRVYLYQNNFVGSIPKEIERLQKLDTLILDKNNLSGEVPKEIGNLVNLRIFQAAHNHIEGPLPHSIRNMSSSLQKIVLQNNQLNGAIPTWFGNLTFLKVLALHGNKFTGFIPQEMTKLTQLEVVDLKDTDLSGPIPDGFFNISTLKLVNLGSNHLSGNLAPSSAFVLPNLEKLILAQNDLSGSIPPSISNATKLALLSLWDNHLSGSIPDSLGELKVLEALDVGGNNLTNRNSESQELSFITPLTKCKHLKSLEVYDNPFHGILPKSVGNFSSSFQNFHAYNCGIYGTIPLEIGNLSGLSVLSIFGNDMTGSIPVTVRGLKELQQMDLSVNRFSGPLSSSLCDLPNLGTIYLFENQLYGPIPSCIGNLTSLIILHLGGNRLNSTLPSTLWNLKNILHLNLYSNSFSGSLSTEVGNLKAAIVMDLSENRFWGGIPDSISGLVNLINLSLAHNNFEGHIPLSIGGMLSLVTLDLSRNKLSGVIPISFEKLTYLSILDVSFNSLSGEIPSNGPFKNFTNQSFLFNNNEALCGDDPKFDVPPCQVNYGQRKRKRLNHKVMLAIGISTITVIFFVAGLIILVFLQRKGKTKEEGEEHGLLPLYSLERVSYNELLRTTDGFNHSNIIGEGASAVVYKGTYIDGINVVIKVFKLKKEWPLKSFERECKILRNLRHRNLTKVLSCCSNSEFKAMVLEYMPKGSLEQWLYGANCFLDLILRLNIMIDVAYALEYLHHGCQMPVAHCDLKPSNVLLDEEMVGHVADFGIAKLLCNHDSVAFTTTFATLGYIAPEYGMGGLISTSCDVYSYGIMLIETFTKRRPNDVMFSEDRSLISWVNDALCSPNGVIEVSDSNLFGPNEDKQSKKTECLTLILKLGVRCCAESPKERMSIKDVVSSLEKVKLNFMFK